ncbi:non-specific lipid transfer protein GPI-anchored 7-like [Impatiens glandulifera]|uniref:non-specific lipid transfer protein GPI-anchored 7-like n=1 Tax=Impatiens glandulifera TaxID=253017 RepID=UPI001FB057FF|nr:non-specific lipid transfer protein GPI-anchored 7-like [Impatiens glandulifera]
MAMAPLMMLVFLGVSSYSVKIAVAQAFPSCAQSLVPCGAYMNVTSPPPSCCDVLKETIEKEFACLCKLYTAPNFFSSLNINKTQALTLPTRCNISGGSCLNGTKIREDCLFIVFTHLRYHINF